MKQDVHELVLGLEVSVAVDVDVVAIGAAVVCCSDLGTPRVMTRLRGLGTCGYV